MTLSDIFAPGMLDGRVVLVTGGGTGLGRAAAAELRACGAEVVIRHCTFVPGWGLECAEQRAAHGVLGSVTANEQQRWCTGRP